MVVHASYSALDLVLERVRSDPFDNLIWFIFCICVISIKTCIWLSTVQAVGTARVTTPRQEETGIQKVRCVRGPASSDVLPRWQFTLNEGGEIRYQPTYLACLWMITKPAGKSQAKNCLKIISHREDFIRNRWENKRGNLLEAAKIPASAVWVVWLNANQPSWYSPSGAEEPENREMKSGCS